MFTSRACWSWVQLGSNSLPQTRLICDTYSDAPLCWLLPPSIKVLGCMEANRWKNGQYLCESAMVAANYGARFVAAVAFLQCILGYNFGHALPLSGTQLSCRKRVIRPSAPFKLVMLADGEERLCKAAAENRSLQVILRGASRLDGLEHRRLRAGVGLVGVGLEGRGRNLSRLVWLLEELKVGSCSNQICLRHEVGRRLSSSLCWSC